MGTLGNVAADIIASAGRYDQAALETALAQIYEEEGLAAKVLHRYPIAPVVKNYSATIAEAVEAHFFGLHHVAVGGLVPVIEGAGRELARLRGITLDGVRAVFTALAEDCKQESTSRSLGASGEVESMMDSFAAFVRDYMYVNSSLYPLIDKTNRHGITHGRYTDVDYGRPLNFYKTIGAIDFLAFVSSFRANISWMRPDPSVASHDLAIYYKSLQNLSAARP
jgi:hypothetical protein